MKQPYKIKEFECVDDLLDWARSMGTQHGICADPHYELRKHCVLTKVFENEKPMKSAILSGDKQGEFYGIYQIKAKLYSFQILKLIFSIPSSCSWMAAPFATSNVSNIPM